MGTALFDTTEIPLWRATGTVTLPGPAALRVGDPCHGLERVSAPLAKGTWVWEVRDADERGASVHRVWEVRLSREDQGPAQDWDWTNEYGEWADTPAEGVVVDGHRGVDAGVIAWAIGNVEGLEPFSDHADLLDTERFEGIPTRGGRLMGTSTGWGDGGYPIAVRVVDEEIVEVRAAYITPDPAELNVAEFTTLLPAALGETVNPAGLTLHLQRTVYTAKDNGDENDLREETYDQLDAVSGTRPDGTPVKVFRTWSAMDEEAAEAEEEQYAPEVISRVSELWGRLPAGEKDAVTARVEVGVPADQPDRVRGWITAYATAPVTVRLAVG